MPLCKFLDAPGIVRAPSRERSHTCKMGGLVSLAALLFKCASAASKYHSKEYN